MTDTNDIKLARKLDHVILHSMLAADADDTLERLWNQRRQGDIITSYRKGYLEKMSPRDYKEMALTKDFKLVFPDEFNSELKAGASRDSLVPLTNRLIDAYGLEPDEFVLARLTPDKLTAQGQKRQTCYALAITRQGYKKLAGAILTTLADPVEGARLLGVFKKAKGKLDAEAVPNPDEYRKMLKGKDPGYEDSFALGMIEHILGHAQFSDGEIMKLAEAAIHPEEHEENYAFAAAIARINKQIHGERARIRSLFMPEEKPGIPRSI